MGQNRSECLGQGSEKSIDWNYVYIQKSQTKTSTNTNRRKWDKYGLNRNRCEQLDESDCLKKSKFS